MPARDTEVDHIRQWLRLGPTEDHNLISLCRHDHRLKDHHGWKLHIGADGALHWTSPLGLHHHNRRPPVITPLPHLPGRAATSTDAEEHDHIGSQDDSSAGRWSDAGDRDGETSPSRLADQDEGRIWWSEPPAGQTQPADPPTPPPLIDNEIPPF